MFKYVLPVLALGTSTVLSAQDSYHGYINVRHGYGLCVPTFMRMLSAPDNSAEVSL